MGHPVQLMAPQFVKPYVNTNKNDAADAEAICEAVGRLNMRFVPVKSSSSRPCLPCTVSDRDSCAHAWPRPTRLLRLRHCLE